MKAYLIAALIFASAACTQKAAPPPNVPDKPPAPAAAPAKPRPAASAEDDSVLSVTSFEQLHEAAAYGTDVIVKDVDAKIAKKKPAKVDKCDTSAKEANLWMMQIKSLIDIKSFDERAAYLAANPETRSQDSKFKDCEKTCLCGAYSELLSGIDASSMNAKDTALLTELQAKGNSGTCKSERPTWFCDSALRKYLKAKN